MKKAWEFAVSLATVGLAVIGIFGLSWTLFRTGGWLDDFIDLQFRHALITFLVTLAAIVLGYLWFNGQIIRGRHNALFNLWFYFIIGVGMFFAVRFAWTGSL
ncbi:MAG TPA: hypothetical protein VFW88_07325 [Burkholderiales bacterium]|nr:hypothetical protein [Burkholderiales bacterium]